VLTDAVAAPASAWPAPAWPAAAPESGPSWSEGATERVGSAVQGTSALLRSSWKVLAAVAAVVLLGVVGRFAWPSPKSTASATTESSREAASTASTASTTRTKPQAKPSPSRSNATRTAGATTGAAPAVAASGIGRLQVESSPTGAHVSIDGKE